MPAKRTSSIQTIQGGSRATIQRARHSQGFQPAPGRKPRKRGKRGKDFRTTDLTEVAKEIFQEDDLRDDTKEHAMASIGLLQTNTDEALHDALQEAERKVARGEAKTYRQQQGGVVLIGNKGAIQAWLLKPAHRQGGQLTSTNETKASKQFLRNLNLAYEERVRRRIDAIGKSLFQSTGGLTDERRKALLEGYKEDRRRRGWKLPDL